LGPARENRVEGYQLHIQALNPDARFVDETRPIRAIWCLGVQGFDPIEVRGDEGIARFEALAAMAYNRRIADALLDRASYLRVAGTVADSGIPIRWLIPDLGHLVRKSAGGVEGLAEVLGEWVGGGDGSGSGLDLDGAVAAGGADELLD
jgi:hypothetical protein